MVPEIWCATDRTFLSPGAIFCPFPSLTAWKIQIPKKQQKSLEISSFYTSVAKFMIIGYTVPEVMHATIFILGYTFPFYPLTAQKMKNSKQLKKHLEISSFNKNVPKIMIICFTVPEVWHVTDRIVAFNLGLFFVLLPP